MKRTEPVAASRAGRSRRKPRFPPENRRQPLGLACNDGRVPGPLPVFVTAQLAGRPPSPWSAMQSASPQCGRVAAAFVPAALPHAPRRAAASRTCRVLMRASRPGGRPARKGPSRTPRDKVEALEAVAAQYGLRKARPGQVLDEKVASDARRAAGSESLYGSLVSAVGQDTLDVAERGVFVTLAVLFAAFLGSGLAISSLAAYKATGTTVPDGWDEFVSSKVEGTFTPSLLVFFALSSAYGLYKQAQLNAGSTGYTERQKKE
jgi:hypothetical protein